MAVPTATAPPVVAPAPPPPSAVETPPTPSPTCPACPVCQRRFTEWGLDGGECRFCRLRFPREPEGGFTDLTLGAAQPLEAAKFRPAATRGRSAASGSEPGLLQRLPFVDTADAVAKVLGLPQSREVEALGRELLRDPRRLLGGDQPPGTATFQNPLVSFAYERGWRSSFGSSGFPGPDEEFRMAQDFLRGGTGLEGDTLLDASCGSGLFSRRFAASGRYRSVVALDFSEAMLRQVDDFSQRELGTSYSEPAPAGSGLSLVRADIARLPFASGSLGGVHAAAAIHCWPAPDAGVAEVARVLRPGGIFVLSTFRPRGPLRQMGLGRNNAPYRFWEEEDLRELTRRCGLLDFKCVKRDPAFIMVCVRKPEE